MIDGRIEVVRLMTMFMSQQIPNGLRVMATAHSYSVAFAEDIMFVTVDVRNESGDNWIAFEKIGMVIESI